MKNTTCPTKANQAARAEGCLLVAILLDMARVYSLLLAGLIVKGRKPKGERWKEAAAKNNDPARLAGRRPLINTHSELCKRFTGFKREPEELIVLDELELNPA